MKKVKNNLKKQILFRSNYSGTMESDIIYNKYFINNLDRFSYNELELIKELFNEYSDPEILLIFSKKIKFKKKFKNLFEKINNY